jgi:hypothetical protein
MKDFVNYPIKILFLGLLDIIKYLTYSLAVKLLYVLLGVDKKIIFEVDLCGVRCKV